MAADEIVVIGGIGTHTALLPATVIDTVGRHLATKAFKTTPDGYPDLLDWLRSHGELLAVGLDGTGAYGAEVARFLTMSGVTIVGVDRPDRKARRDNDKSDPVDAYAAATAVLSGRAAGTISACQLEPWRHGPIPRPDIRHSRHDGSQARYPEGPGELVCPAGTPARTAPTTTGRCSPSSPGPRFRSYSSRSPLPAATSHAAQRARRRF
ncbi:transposase [Streptomyces sp. NPDC001185]|uniref:IS110 family transposase n=1 Tax=Streptomyces sp. NPDC001185 TaxID=3154380 RepID=UPI0033242523